MQGPLSCIYKAHPQPAVDPQLASELLQILADVYNRFPHVISSSSPLQTTSITSLLSILSSGRLTIRKRAIPALIALINNNPALFDQVKPHVAQGLAAGGDTAKVWSNVLASLARGMNASKVGALVGEGQVVGLVLKQVEDPEDTDMVEGALVVGWLARLQDQSVEVPVTDVEGVGSAGNPLSCRDGPICYCSVRKGDGIDPI